MIAVWIAVAAAIAGGVGYLIGLRQRPPAPVEVTPNAPAPDGVTASLDAILNTLTMGVAVFNGREVVAANQPARLALSGEPDAAILGDRMRSLAEQASRGAAVDDRLDLFGPPARSYALRAVPLRPEGGFSRQRPLLGVVSATDIADAARTEAIRRDFVANISHELKTPVGAVLLLAETLTGETDPEIASRFAGRIVQEIERLAATIDDLTVLTRAETRGIEQPEPVDLGLVASRVAQRLTAAAQQAHVHLQVVAPEPVVVQGDRRQLESAIFNLADNAVKFSEADGTVTVAARVDHNQAVVEIRDDGVGIPRSDLDRIFERFYRVDRARSRATGGTGLGLAIVRHVAANHDGAIDVDSTEGVGSVFTLRVPFQVVDGDHSATGGGRSAVPGV